MMAPTDKGNTSCDGLADAARQEKLDELDILRQSLEEKQREVAGYHDQLLRLKAEFENFRKRSEREKQGSFLWGKEEVLLRFIGVMDIFHQAEKHMATATDIDAIRQGVAMIRTELAGFLKAEGIVEIESLGKRFDLGVHEGVSRVEDAAAVEETVVEELQKGYSFNGRVVRPARVKVAVPPPEQGGCAHGAAEQAGETPRPAAETDTAEQK